MSLPMETIPTDVPTFQGGAGSSVCPQGNTIPLALPRTVVFCSVDGTIGDRATFRVGAAFAVCTPLTYCGVRTYVSRHRARKAAFGERADDGV